MANAQHLTLLHSGVNNWNNFRYGNQSFVPDLSYADLTRAELFHVDLRDAELTGVNFSRAILNGASFTHANLKGANFTGASVSEGYFLSANLEGADLSETHAHHAIFRGSNIDHANLRRASLVSADMPNVSLRGARVENCDLTFANLTGSNLSDAQIQGGILNSSILVGTNLTRANLSGSSIHGIAAWDLILDGAIQDALTITKRGEPIISVDNIEVAQFVYLLLNSPKIRQVIETIGRKLVLILGRFTPERKKVLDGIRDGLRAHNYLPMLVDFEVPANRDITETVSTLAHLARFVIADITAARSIPQELMAIVPGLPSVPIQPLILESEEPYGMFEHLRRYAWVLKPYVYADGDSLIRDLAANVIAPAEERLNSLGKP